MVEIRKMERGDIDSVVELMAKAFQNAALYHYFEENDAKRGDFLRLIFSHRVNFGFEDRDADLAFKDGKLIGAALWGKPSSSAPPENRALNDAVLQYGTPPGIVTDKWHHFHETLFKSLAAVCPEPHWSLAPIAVVPEVQGTGIASALIKKKLPQIDAEGSPCLLGTQDKINTEIYAHYGFKIVNEALIAKGNNGAPDVVSYSMLRYPLDNAI